MKKWTGHWIEYSDCKENAAAVFEKDFYLEKRPGFSEILISGLGFYVLEINNRRATQDLLTPAFTAYNQTVLYNTYDISELLVNGQNTIRVTLGNGWYHEPGEDCFDFEHAVWKNKLQMICELYIDGQFILCSDSSWRCTSGKTRYNSVRFGEDYDATFIPEPWSQARLSKAPGGILKPMQIPPIRVERTVLPVKVLQCSVYDFGENTAGDTEITVHGERGAQVEIIYGERLDENGNIDQTLIKRHPTIPRNQIDHYTLAGLPEGECWHPDFSYKGFRYVQIKGNITVEKLTARVFHTQLKTRGHFTCSDPVINAIHQAVLHSTLTNYHHIPTDCPHREKNGWTGDAHLSSEQSLYNFDMEACYEKYVNDIINCQWACGQLPCIAPTSVYGFNFQSGPTWDAALIVIPWNLYRFTGETRYLEQAYPSMVKYLRYAESISEDHLCASGLGDFLPDPSVEPCPTPMLLTCFVFYLAGLAAKIAKRLGFEENAQAFTEQSIAAKNAVIEKYLNRTRETESYLATVLHFGLAEHPQPFADKLVRLVRAKDHCAGGGIFSSAYVLDALTEYGYFEDALSVATQTKFPSWGYMLRDGGNSLWEHWSGKQGSLNHHMRSPIDAWFYRSIAGLQVDDDHPGFSHIVLKPHFSSRIQSFSADYNSRHGKIEVRLQNRRYTVSLPNGVSATLYLTDRKIELTGCNTLSIDEK